MLLRWTWRVSKRSEANGYSRSVMLLDVLGCTRTTMEYPMCERRLPAGSLLVGGFVRLVSLCPQRGGQSESSASCQGLLLAIIPRKRGMPSTGTSTACPEYVPAICTHRPSLLPSGHAVEASSEGPVPDPSARWKSNLVNIVLLEEAKVVTRLL